MGVTSATTGFEAHRRRGPFNAAFFSAMAPFIEHSVRRYKQRVFAGLPPTVVEIGPGVGTNLRYLRPGSTWVAIEPTPPCTAGCGPPPSATDCGSIFATVSPSGPDSRPAVSRP